MLPEPLGWGVSLDPLSGAGDTMPGSQVKASVAKPILGSWPVKSLGEGAKSSLPTPSYLKWWLNARQCPEPGHEVSAQVEVRAPFSGCP